MSKTIVIFNQKGGVGKTTTAINLSYALAKLGQRVLCVDMDAQSNLSSGLLEDYSEQASSTYTLLTDDTKDIRSLIKPTKLDKLHVIDSSTDIAGLEIELAQKGDWKEILKRRLHEIKGDYDFIFIDSPPSLGILSIMSLAAANSVIIPIQAEYYALEGVSKLIRTIELVKKNYNQALTIEGVLITMFDARNNLHTEVFSEVQNFFGAKLYTAVINRNIRLAEAPSYSMSIFEYDKASKGAENYMNLAEEFLQKQGR